MVKYLVAVLCALLSTQAVAQSFPKPPDVQAFVQVPPQYKTDGSANNVVDPAVTPPAAVDLTDIPIPSTTNRIVTGSLGNDSSGFCLTNAFGGSGVGSYNCPEAKFRTHINFSHMLPDDPIRNYGQPGQSHLHCFFGNGSTNGYSTYQSLRKHALTSTAAGTDANGTAYWFPCMVSINPFGDGKNYVVKNNLVSVYYIIGDAINAPYATHLPIGLRYVFGYEMDDDYAWLQTYLDAANAASGQTRYFIGDPNRNGLRWTQAYYLCQNATATAPYNRPDQGTGAAMYLKNPDGSDPYGGTCNNSNQLFYIGVNGADCWDGRNLWSPGGYKHVITRIWDNKVRDFVCPSNYYRIPPIILEIAFTQYGWSDRQHWELSSDLSKRSGTPFTPGAAFPPGSTFHTDWMFGWDGATITKWQQNCIGVEHHIPHQCSTSVISATERLMGGIVDGEAGAGGRNPQTTSTWMPHVNSTDVGYALIPPAWNGALSGMHIHH